VRPNFEATALAGVGQDWKAERRLRHELTVVLGSAAEKWPPDARERGDLGRPSCRGYQLYVAVTVTAAAIEG